MSSDGTQGDKPAFAQGSILSGETAAKLGLIDAGGLEVYIAVVISHDCDIAEQDIEAEPFIEVVIGRWIDSCDPNLSNSKSTRLLHLEVEVGEEHRPVELQIIKRASVRKAEMFDSSPDNRFTLSSDSKLILRNWLAARYNRPAFPDELNRRLRPMHEAMIASGKGEPRGLLAYYLHYEPDGDELGTEEVYEVWLYVVYQHEVAGAKAFAQETAKAIQNKAERKFQNGNTWKLIDLRLCEAVSDTEFTLYDAMTTKRYRLDYLSLRKSPPEPTIPLG